MQMGLGERMEGERQENAKRSATFFTHEHMHACNI